MKTLIPKFAKITDKEAIKFLEDKGYLVVKVPTTQSKTLINNYYKAFADKNKSSGVYHVPDMYQDKKDLDSLNKFYKRGALLGYNPTELYTYLKNSINQLLQFHEDLNIRLPDKFCLLLSSKFSFIFRSVADLQKKKKSKAYKELLKAGCEPSGEQFEKFRTAIEKKLLEE